ncbi:MAG: acyl-CoA dehydrogenase family protein [Steroidobacteraceae bacterium]|nr:acyl-CoA dehydrogenase family protein [Steroidobacteraceae bacterium]MDW8257858.1 acyl-CoA dehydrogenase family protein [Gammaproteobacteria bacterium]
MNFELSERGRYWLAKLERFMVERVLPNDAVWRQQVRDGLTRPVPIVEQLKSEAKAAGLWNLFMPPVRSGERIDETFEFVSPGLSNVEYAPLAETMGRVRWAPEVFNCSAPDTGNMEVLNRYGTREQKERWLRPLMDGEIRSAFLMTEPAVASSDATNIETEIRRDGDEYVINGRKWWASGVGHPHCRLLFVMGKSDRTAPPYRQQSMVLVPADAPGVTVERLLPVYGYDHAHSGGHGQVLLDNVRIPISSLVLGEGRGFEIAQGRLGPGRIHHAMRIVGQAEVALERMCRRLLTRRAFGKTIAEHSVWEERVAQARIDIDMMRLLCLKAAHVMDTRGNKAARNEIAMIKVIAPRAAARIIDNAIQAHGAAGICDDFGLAEAYADMRMLRFADGPDEVHCRQVARAEFAKYRQQEAVA